MRQVRVGRHFYLLRIHQNQLKIRRAVAVQKTRQKVLIITDLPDPVCPATSMCGHLGQVRHDGFAANVLTDYKA